MGSTPAVRGNAAKEPETKVPSGIPLGWGVLLIIAAAGGWILLLVAIHDITAKLLSLRACVTRMDLSVAA